MLPAFGALSLFCFVSGFQFLQLLGRVFRGLWLLDSRFRITALNFDIQAGGFRIFIGFRRLRGFREFQFLGRPFSQNVNFWQRKLRFWKLT